MNCYITKKKRLYAQIYPVFNCVIIFREDSQTTGRKAMLYSTVSMLINACLSG